MDRGYLRPHSPPRRFGGHPARNSTGLLDLHPQPFDSYHNPPRGSRESLPRSSADRFERLPARPQHRDSLPLRRNPEDYEVAPRHPDPRRPLIVPPPDANYRPKIQSAIDSSPEFRRLRPRDDEAYYVQPAASRTGRPRTLSSSGYGNREYPAVRRVDSDRSKRDSSNAYYYAPAIRAKRDKDDHDYGYEYTNHKEQAYRDFATRTRPRRESDTGTRERPASITHADELAKRPSVSRADGPPVTTRGFARLDNRGTVRQYHYPRDAASEESDSLSRRRPVHDGTRGDNAVHQDRLDDYSSATDERSHKHRSRREHSADPRYQTKYDSDAGRSRKYHERHLSANEDDQYRHRHRSSRDESREHRRSDADRKDRKEESESDTRRRDRVEESDREHRRRRGTDEERDYRARERADETHEGHKLRRHKREESYDRRNDGRYDDRAKDKHGEKHETHRLGEAAFGAAAAAAAAGGAGLYVKHKNERDRASEAAGENTKEPKEERRRRRRSYKESNEESDTSTTDEQPDAERKERRRRRRDSERERSGTIAESKNGQDIAASTAPAREREDKPTGLDALRQVDGSRRRRPDESDSGSSNKDGDQKRQVRVVSPSREVEPKPKGILKQPKEKFPEDPAPVREGVAPLKDAGKKGVPPNARWTKIDRRLVNPEALEIGNERYEERPDYVIVLRVLNKEEIEAYAAKTAEIREARHEESRRAHTAALEERPHDSSDDEKPPLAIADRPYNEPDLIPGIPGFDTRQSASMAAITNSMAASAPDLQPVSTQRPDPYAAHSYQRLNPSGSGSASLNSSITSAATWPQPGPPNSYPPPPQSQQQQQQQPIQQSPPPVSAQQAGSTSGVIYPQVPLSGSQQYPYPQAQFPPPPQPASGSTSPPQSQAYGNLTPMQVTGVTPRG